MRVGVAVVVALASVVAACSRAPEEPQARTTKSTAAVRTPSCPRDPDGGPPALPVYTLRVPEAGAEVELEVVHRDADTSRGLMYRTQMPPNHGMIFKLTPKIQRFWMHNTCLSLDMLFLDDDGKIVGILADVPPLNDDARSVEKVSTYVVELNAGASARLGLREGQHFELPEAIRVLPGGT